MIRSFGKAEKNMIKRAEKYEQYKTQYYQNNPDIDRDEF